MEALISFLSGVLDWVLDLLLWVPRKVFGWLCDAFGSVLASLPAFPGAADFSTGISSLASGTLWFLDLCAAGYGLSAVISALLLRFGLKLLPTLGF